MVSTGAAQERGMKCLNCNTENAADARFCSSCGSRLVASPPKIAAERRHLTVLFADLVGSTALSTTLDPEELRELYAHYQADCAQVVARYEGHIAQYLGDGILAYFGYPTAHEDDAVRAVRSGLEIIERVKRASYGGRQLRVRIGIHTGHVVIGDVGSGDQVSQLALGETPNVASRVQGQAEPNTVMISEVTRRLVMGFFELQDCGARSLQGLSRPIGLYRVLSAAARVNRFEAMTTAGVVPFVGRSDVLETIRHDWARAISGAGRMIVIRGEAGIGKSRLLGEARRVARETPHVLLDAQCSPYQTASTLQPIADMVARGANLTPGSESAEAFDRLNQFVTRRGIDPREAVPLLGSLLNLPADARFPLPEMAPTRARQRTLEILTEILIHSDDGIPVMAQVEDAHWADPTTLELLGMVARRQAEAPLLLIVTTRPGPDVPGKSEPHCREIPIEALPSSDVRALVENVTRPKALPDEVVRQIVARAGGVPLFVEAVTRTVIESGMLKELPDRYELTGPIPDALIPQTVHDSLTARIDRLGPDRHIAQLGAAIGRDFSFELLQAISGASEVELERSLGRLVVLDLVTQEGVPPRATYTFKHALIQDAAYESLLRKTRAQVHGKIADVLAAQPFVVKNRPELLARHYEGSGRTNEAIDCWTRAGVQASERAAVAECVAYLKKAIALLETLPEDDPERIGRETNVQLTLAPALMATRGWGARDVETACRRARALCERTGNSQGLLAALWGLWTVLFVRGEHERALEAGDAVLKMALATDNRILHVAARHGVGFTHYFMGHYAEAREQAERAIEIYDVEQERLLIRTFQISSTTCCLAFLTMSLRLSGYIDQAARRQKQLEDVIREINIPTCTGTGLGIAMYHHLDTRDLDKVVATVDEAYPLCVDAGFLFWSTTMRMYRGWAQAMRGDPAGGLAELREGLEGYLRTESGIYIPTFYQMLAEAQAAAGQPEAALESLAGSERIVESLGERYYYPEHFRVRGEIQRSMGKNAEAEVSLRRAIEVARELKARLLELRAGVVLGRWLHEEGRSAEARALVQPVYEWFTEGLDTRDLVAARELLSVLPAA
jgi:class 3 adenylate cyclase/tetratricopeptide (TPR) repeat protein